MNLSLKVLSIVSLAATPILGNADPVQQLNQSDLLSIQAYNIKSSVNAGGMLNRTISVVARNETNAPLYHVYLYLDGMPSHVTGEGWAYFPELGAGISQESATTVDYTVDLSRQEIPELELIWQIKTEIDGEQIIDEVAVSEVIQ